MGIVETQVATYEVQCDVTGCAETSFGKEVPRIWTQTIWWELVTLTDGTGAEYTTYEPRDKKLRCDTHVLTDWK